MKSCVFLGPTLEKRAAESILEAVYLPPVRQGDIVRAVTDHQPTILAIVDGFFEQTPAVWHKEILWALEQDIVVFGAASMGAMRASELDSFGMIGVGRIFEAYRDGVYPPFSNEVFEDDDEVAVAHGPADIGYAGSTAMVDIRSSLAAACEAQVISVRERNELALLAKSIFYKERSFGALFEAANSANIASRNLSTLKTWIADGNGIPQKRLDAELLLSTISKHDHPPAPVQFRFERTIVWETALADIESVAPK